jgi:hypothetical protein
MKTYPILRDDGSLAAFEVTSMWVTFRPLYRVLRSIEGVTDVQRRYFSDDRVSFLYREEMFVVNEPWGDSSRYWVGPRDATTLDITPIHEAFRQYLAPAARVWSRVARVVGSG